MSKIVIAITQAGGRGDLIFGYRLARLIRSRYPDQDIYFINAKRFTSDSEAKADEFDLKIHQWLLVNFKISAISYFYLYDEAKGREVASGPESIISNSEWWSDVEELFIGPGHGREVAFFAEHIEDIPIHFISEYSYDSDRKAFKDAEEYLRDVKGFTKIKKYQTGLSEDELGIFIEPYSSSKVSLKSFPVIFDDLRGKQEDIKHTLEKINEEKSKIKPALKALEDAIGGVASLHGNRLDMFISCHVTALEHTAPADIKTGFLQAAAKLFVSSDEVVTKKLEDLFLKYRELKAVKVGLKVDIHNLNNNLRYIESGLAFFHFLDSADCISVYYNSQDNPHHLELFVAVQNAYVKYKECKQAIVLIISSALVENYVPHMPLNLLCAGVLFLQALDFHLLQRFYAYASSHPGIGGCTGDQSLGDTISAGLVPVYHVIPTKREFARALHSQLVWERHPEYSSILSGIKSPKHKTESSFEERCDLLSDLGPRGVRFFDQAKASVKAIKESRNLYHTLTHAFNEKDDKCFDLVDFSGADSTDSDEKVKRAEAMAGAGSATVKPGRR